MLFVPLYLSHKAITLNREAGGRGAPLFAVMSRNGPGG